MDLWGGGPYCVYCVECMAEDGRGERGRATCVRDGGGGGYTSTVHYGGVISCDCGVFFVSKRPGGQKHIGTKS